MHQTRRLQTERHHTTTTRAHSCLSAHALPALSVSAKTHIQLSQVADGDLHALLVLVLLVVDEDEQSCCPRSRFAVRQLCRASSASAQRLGRGGREPGAGQGWRREGSERGGRAWCDRAWCEGTRINKHAKATLAGHTHARNQARLAMEVVRQRTGINCRPMYLVSPLGSVSDGDENLSKCG